MNDERWQSLYDKNLYAARLRRSPPVWDIDELLATAYENRDHERLASDMLLLAVTTATAIQSLAAESGQYRRVEVAELVDALCAYVQVMDEIAQPWLSHIGHEAGVSTRERRANDTEPTDEGQPRREAVGHEVNVASVLRAVHCGRQPIITADPAPSWMTAAELAVWREDPTSPTSTKSSTAYPGRTNPSRKRRRGQQMSASPLALGGR